MASSSPAVKTSPRGQGGRLRPVRLLGFPVIPTDSGKL